MICCFCCRILVDLAAQAAVPQTASSPVPTELSILEGLRVGKASVFLPSLTEDHINFSFYVQVAHLVFVLLYFFNSSPLEKLQHFLWLSWR